MGFFPLRRQPLKGLFIIYQLLSTALVRVPIWLLKAIITPRPWRPRRSWGARRIFWMKSLKHLSYVKSKVGELGTTPNHKAITPGPGVQGVWVNATPQLVTGELKAWAIAAKVSPINVPGYWIHRKGTSTKVAAPPSPGEKVIYAFHGGGYVSHSAHPSDPTSAIVHGLLKHVKPVQRVFSIEYRLSKSKPFPEENPFPAALLDALAGYDYLVNTVGFSPSDIIVEGDSAGGNLALALTRYLVENAASLPNLSPPSAIILLSPWCDLSTTHHLSGSSVYTCTESDFIKTIDDSRQDYAKVAFIGPHGLGAAELNPYISPASIHPSMSASFVGFPRTFIAAGGAEILRDSIRTLNTRMVKDLGEDDGTHGGTGKVRYLEVPDGIHDYVVFSWHEPERTQTLLEIAKWLEGS